MTIDPHFRRMMDDEAAARARHERDLPPVRPSAHMADLSDLAASDAQPYAREEFRGEDVSRRIMVDVAASKVIVPLDIWSRICDTFNAAAAVGRGVRETPDTERLDWWNVNGIRANTGTEGVTQVWYMDASGEEQVTAEHPSFREAIDEARESDTARSGRRPSDGGEDG